MEARVVIGDVKIEKRAEFFKDILAILQLYFLSFVHELLYDRVPFQEGCSFFLENDIHEELIRSIILCFFREKFCFGDSSNDIIDALFYEHPSRSFCALKGNSWRLQFSVIKNYDFGDCLQIHLIVICDLIH